MGMGRMLRKFLQRGVGFSLSWDLPTFYKNKGEKLPGEKDKNELSWADIEFFTPAEFDSPDLIGSGNQIDLRIVQVCDNIRRRYGKPMKINSGVRSVEHNASEGVGGRSNSGHLIKDVLGHAADLAIPDSVARLIAIEEAVKAGIKRIGIGRGFIHLDNDESLPQGVCWLY